MPTYDYICPNGHRFEVIHSVTVSGPDACPVCGAAPVRKAFSAPSIHFKGSGWAKKDRSAASRPTAGAAAAGSSDDGAKGETATKTDAGGSSKDTGKESSGGKESGRAKDTPSSTKGSSGSGAGSSSSSGTAAD